MIQFIEYILECFYSGYNLGTEISGLVSLYLPDFSGGMRFDDSVFDVDRAKFTGGFGYSLIQNCILFGYQRHFYKLPEVFQNRHNIS